MCTYVIVGKGQLVISLKRVACVLAEVEDSAGIRHVEPVTPEALEPTS